MESYKAGIPTGKKCEKCGEGELLERISRHGFFLGCSRYPDCDFIQDLSPELPEDDGEHRRSQYCDNCGHEMVIKRGRFGVVPGVHGLSGLQDDAAPGRGHARGAAAGRAAGRKVPRLRLATGARSTGSTANSSAARPIRSANSSAPRRWASNARSAGPANCWSAWPRRAAGASSTAATVIRSAISPRRTGRSPSPARSAARRSSWRSTSKIGAVRACIKEGCDWEIAAPEVPAAAGGRARRDRSRRKP